MKRGLLNLCIFLILAVTLLQASFALSSIGAEKDLNISTIQSASEQTNNCLLFQTMDEQIQCRLTSSHLLPTNSILCSETQRDIWCENIIEDAVECVQKNGTAKDKCFFSKANLHISIEYTTSESYIILLLLDLINDAQTNFENGELSLGDTTNLISQLNNIAHSVMRHEPQSLLAILFAEYARDYENSQANA